jgi:hypothetical protein
MPIRRKRMIFFVVIDLSSVPLRYRKRMMNLSQPSTVMDHDDMVAVVMPVMTMMNDHDIGVRRWHRRGQAGGSHEQD